MSWFYVGLCSLDLDYLSFLSRIKRNRKFFVKHFPVFSKIPSISMDAHSRDALPRQHRVTTEFIIETQPHGQWREMRGNDSYKHLGGCKKMVKTKQPRVSSACTAALAPGVPLSLLAAMLMTAWSHRLTHIPGSLRGASPKTRPTPHLYYPPVGKVLNCSCCKSNTVAPCADLSEMSCKTGREGTSLAWVSSRVRCKLQEK